jgi:hypothetical protein
MLEIKCFGNWICFHPQVREGRQPPCWVHQSQDNQSQSHSYMTTDGQSASLSWCQAPIWDPQPNFLLLPLIIFRQVTDLLMWGALSDEKSGLSGQVLLGIAGTGLDNPSQSQSHITTDSQSALVSGAHLGPATNFSFPSRFSLDSCRLVIL